MRDRARRCELAVFTEPVVWSAAQRRRGAAIRAFGPFLPRAVRPPVPERAGGHYGVTRSVLVGLRRLKVPHLYNPGLDGLRAEAAVVLSSPAMVERAIAWKAVGGCEKLLAGPNIAVLPCDDGQVLKSPLLDRVIVPSEWVRVAYAEEAPEIAGRIVVHPAGVDAAYWAPRSRLDLRRNVVVYDKMMPALADKVKQSVESWGLPCDIVRYGAYAPHQYRRVLDRAFACVMLTESESQGIALAEAWAMDVPTFVLHRTSRVINGREMQVSTAPYLSRRTGRFWSAPEELHMLISQFEPDEFEPRTWVLDHMTDAIAAQSLLKMVSEPKPC